RLESGELAQRALVLHVAGVQRGGGLKEEYLDLVVGDGTMLDAARDDHEFTRSELDDAIAEFQAKTAAMDEEHFVFVLVMMPDEFAFELDELDLLAIQLAGDPRTPMLVERSEFLGERDLFHGSLGDWVCLVAHPRRLPG